MQVARCCKYSGHKYKYKYFEMVLEYYSSTSTSTKYYISAIHTSSLTVNLASKSRRGSKGLGGCTAPHLVSPRSPQMQCQVVALCNVCATAISFCLAFADADIELDFVLMTSAYSQYLKDSCKQHSALVGS